MTAGRWFAALAAAAVLSATAGVGAPGAAQVRGPDTPPGTLAGRITNPDGAPVPYAWVRARGPGAAAFTTLADRDGAYVLTVSPGRVDLRFDAVGHRAASVEVDVPPGASVRVDAVLEAEPLDLPGFVVEAEAFAVPPPEPRSLEPAAPPDPAMEVAALTLDAGLAGVASAAAAARSRDGGPPASGDQVLLMRGSTADLKLLLLDGAPVYTPFHLGGLLDPFEPGVLGRAAHYVGAAPSRYDGGLDYILDLETRHPEAGASRVSGAVDLLSVRAAGEWAVDRGGVLGSARALHDAASRLRDGVGGPYGYADALVRGAWTVGAADVGFTAFGNRESVTLGLPDAPYVPREATWSNRAFSVSVDHLLGPVALEWRAAVSRYDAALPLRTDSVVGSLRSPVLAEGRTGRLRATVDGRLEAREATVRFGLALDRTAATYASSHRSPQGYRRADARFDGRVLGGHGEFSRALGETVGLRLGLRIDHFDPGGTRGALRGALTWALTPDAVLTLAGGRYHQFTRGGDLAPEAALAEELAGGTPTGAADPPLLEVATGDHVLVGLDQSLTPSVRLGLQGWVKRFDDLAGTSASRTSSGVDLRLRAGGAHRTGWLGYALDWTWENVTGTSAARLFQGRHVLSAGFRGTVSGPWGVAARVAFSDGLPLTEVPLDASVSLNTPDRPLEEGLDQTGATPVDVDGFLRVDVELYGEWDAPVGAGRIRPYLRVLNALDRRDALFYYFEPWRSPELRPLGRHGVWPVVGLAWSF